LQTTSTTPLCRHESSGAGSLTMRKQKASDRRTRRMQMGGEQIVQELIRDNLRQTITSSPMDVTGEWKYKKPRVQPIKEKSGGRGRSRKRATLYNSLSSYHNKFLSLLTDEYRHEVGLICSFLSVPFSNSRVPYLKIYLYHFRKRKCLVG
jgi:hypothetical protein